MRILLRISRTVGARGFFIAAVGLPTYAPIISTSKKQGCVSTSICESEVVRMNFGLEEAISVVALWQASTPPSRLRGVSPLGVKLKRGAPQPAPHRSAEAVSHRPPALLLGGISAWLNLQHYLSTMFQCRFWHTQTTRVQKLFWRKAIRRN